MLALVGLSLGLGAAMYAMTGGNEVATDAPVLMYLVDHPHVLWKSYAETGLRSNWGSFPPLMPLGFGALVQPWSWIGNNYWELRLGVLGWSLVVLLGCGAILARVGGPRAAHSRSALWLLALIPSVWGACAFLPQEEIYVAGFVLLLYAVARAGKWKLVAPLLALTALAGKYYVLVVLVPLAFASPRPWRHLVLWGAAVGATLLAYVGFHWAAHGVTPILDYHHGPDGGISVWALLHPLGLAAPAGVVKAAGVGIAGSTALLLGWLGRRHGVPLAYTMTAALYVTILVVVPSFTAYELWAVPLAAVCVAWTQRAWMRRALAGLMLSWAAGAWGLNFFRGVGLALANPRKAGKMAFAAKVQGALGADFPFAELQLACLVLVLLSGIGLVAMLWAAGRRPVARPVETGAPSARDSRLLATAVASSSHV